MAEPVAIILAAGESTRMKTSLAKVLHEVCGRAMLEYVVEACRQAGVRKMYVVVGYGADQVKERFGDAEDIVWVNQPEQKGTAHAVMCCAGHLKDFTGQTFVLCGDAPLVRPETLRALVEKHRSERPAATLATAVLDDPTGYGRIVRNDRGDITAIVEEADCDDRQRAICEVNPSFYLFENKVLFDVLEHVGCDNAKNEYYLTDVIAIMIKAGHRVCAVAAVAPEEAIGVNTRAQLGRAGAIMQRRIQQNLMDGGVTIVDPANTWIDGSAQVGPDTVIEPFTYIGPGVRIGRNCRVGPFACLTDDTIIKDGQAVGPFGRPGSRPSYRENRDNG